MLGLGIKLSEVAEPKKRVQKKGGCQKALGDAMVTYLFQESREGVAMVLFFFQYFYEKEGRCHVAFLACAKKFYI